MCFGIVVVFIDQHLANTTADRSRRVEVHVVAFIHGLLQLLSLKDRHIVASAESTLLRRLQVVFPEMLLGEDSIRIGVFILLE